MDYLLFMVLGVIAGFILNVFIRVLPRAEKCIQEQNNQASCDTGIKAHGLVPVFDFLWPKDVYRGKELARYILVMGLTVGATVLAYASYGVVWLGLVVALIWYVLIIIAFIDIEFMIIPDKLILALSGLAVMYTVLGVMGNLMWHIIAVFVISVPMFLLSIAIDGAFGGGDVKLIAVCGLILGIQGVLLAAFVALLFAAGYGIYLKTRKFEGKHMAFGQFIVLGVFITMVFGETLISSYLQIAGF